MESKRKRRGEGEREGGERYGEREGERERERGREREREREGGREGERERERERERESYRNHTRKTTESEHSLGVLATHAALLSSPFCQGNESHLLPRGCESMLVLVCTRFFVTSPTF